MDWIMTKEEAKHMSEVLKAYSEGKPIQQYVSLAGDHKWLDITQIILCDINDPKKYRIKPEPKLRPYVNAEEFLLAQKEHGPYIKEIIGLTLRYINPIMVFDDHLIFWFSNNCMNFKYSDLISKMYSWQDGTPCGIYESL